MSDESAADADLSSPYGTNNSSSILRRTSPSDNNPGRSCPLVVTFSTEEDGGRGATATKVPLNDTAGQLPPRLQRNVSKLLMKIILN